LRGNWGFSGKAERGEKKRAESASVKITDNRSKEGTPPDEVVGIFDAIDWTVQPLNTAVTGAPLKAPPDSGGLLVSLYHYRQFLAFGAEGFKQEFSHGGVEPFYLPPPDTGKPDWKALRRDCEVIRTTLGGVNGKWYFSEGLLIGAEISLDREEDPCELYFSNY